MAQLIAKVLLWLFVINLGIAFGAGLYESQIVVPQWISVSPESGYRWNAEAARQANTGLNFWVYVTTVPLTLLTLASLVAAWWTRGAVRTWWLVAATASLVDRIFTFSYFIPTMLKLMSDENLPQSEAVATALQWANLDYVRHAITLVAWLAALKAFALLSGWQRSEQSCIIGLWRTPSCWPGVCATSTTWNGPSPPTSASARSESSSSSGRPGGRAIARFHPVCWGVESATWFCRSSSSKA